MWGAVGKEGSHEGGGAEWTAITNERALQAIMRGSSLSQGLQGSEQGAI